METEKNRSCNKTYNKSYNNTKKYVVPTNSPNIVIYTEDKESIDNFELFLAYLIKPKDFDKLLKEYCSQTNENFEKKREGIEAKVKEMKRELKDITKGNILYKTDKNQFDEYLKIRHQRCPDGMDFEKYRKDAIDTILSFNIIYGMAFDILIDQETKASYK